MKSANQPKLNDERYELLRQVNNWLDTPMVVLGFAWLALLIQELINGLTPFWQGVGTLIWVVFILDFLLQFTLAPEKVPFLKKNWLTVISLFIPALRAFRVVRVFRVLRVVRGMRLVRVVSSVNRGMRALGASMGRRGFGYVLLLTLLMTGAGAAGIYAFERDEPGTALNSFGEALWWTAMLMTTLGSEYWPKSAEGRALCFLLSLYAFAVFGYVTATLATYFVGRDAENEAGEVAGAQEIRDLTSEVRALRDEVRRLAER